MNPTTLGLSVASVGGLAGNKWYGNKKPVQRARKTARCVIYQFPQSTLLFVTAWPLVSHLDWPFPMSQYSYFSKLICRITRMA